MILLSVVCEVVVVTFWSEFGSTISVILGFVELSVVLTVVTGLGVVLIGLVVFKTGNTEKKKDKKDVPFKFSFPVIDVRYGNILDIMILLT